MKIPRSLLLAAQTGHDIACERDECGVQMDGPALARTGAIEAYREEMLRMAKAVQAACLKIANIQNAIAFLDLDEIIDRALADSVDDLRQAVQWAEANHPLLRCSHGNALMDHSGERLEPTCGCRTLAEKGEESGA